MNAMYSHCVHCQRALGANEVLEAFPVGERVAFDEVQGRLWVVCRACERWNLAPFESRWEAIEQAERAYRGTRVRMATDNIGLKRVRVLFSGGFTTTYDTVMTTAVTTLTVNVNMKVPSNAPIGATVNARAIALAGAGEPQSVWLWRDVLGVQINGR
jgi:hypothetical protein